MVDRLLGIFRHIEPVSVVVRSVHPRNFGILSPPVEKLLERCGPTATARTATCPRRSRTPSPTRDANDDGRACRG